MRFSKAAGAQAESESNGDGIDNALSFIFQFVSFGAYPSFRSTFRAAARPVVRVAIELTVCLPLVL